MGDEIRIISEDFGELPGGDVSLTIRAKGIPELTIVSEVTTGFFDEPVDLGGGAIPFCGAGCASPQLVSVGGAPAIGNALFGFEIQGTPDAGFAALFVGIGAPLSPGLPLWGGTLYAPTAAPSFFHKNGFVAVSGSGGCSGVATFIQKLPNKPSLIGVPVTPQGVFLCPSGAMTPTNALHFEIQ